MPFYDFLNKKTGEIKSLFFGMNDKKKYIDSDGLEWERQFSIPCAAIDTKSDPFDDKKNLQKITQTKGSLGNILDYSKEQSDKRSEKIGDIDPKKKKYWANYEKTRGKKHMDERKQKLKEIVKDVSIKWSGKNK